MIYQYDVINIIIEKNRAIVIFSDPDYQNYHNDHQDYHNSQHIGRNHIYGDIYGDDNHKHNERCNVGAQI